VKPLSFREVKRKLLKAEFVEISHTASGILNLLRLLIEALARQLFHTTQKSLAKHSAVFFVKSACLKMNVENSGFGLRENG